MATFEGDGPLHSNKGGNDQFNLSSVVTNIWFGFNNNPVHRVSTEKFKQVNSSQTIHFLQNRQSGERREYIIKIMKCIMYYVF